MSKSIPDVNSEEGSDPDVNGPASTMQSLLEEAKKSFSPPPSDATPESGTTGMVTPIQTHIRPIDPTRQISRPGPMPVVPVVVKPPKTDTAKLMSMLDAAFQLAQGEVTKPVAKTLIITNGLERAFQAKYPDIAKSVLGKIDLTPDTKCRGGVILEIEMEDGYVHIITDSGIITFTGQGLTQKGNNS